jgi:hypothetical protein
VIKTPTGSPESQSGFHIRGRTLAWISRMAVGLLLGCAIAVALVAAGLDLMLIRP